METLINARHTTLTGSVIDAYGATADKAKAALKNGLMIHALRVGIEPSIIHFWIESALTGAVITRLESGNAYELGRVLALPENVKIHFEVQTYIGNDFENVWNDENGLVYFDTFEAAQAELDSHLITTQEEFEAGNLDDPYDRDDFRIAPIALKDSLTRITV